MEKQEEETKDGAGVLIDEEAPKTIPLTRETAELFARRVRNDLCKNAVVEAVETDEEFDVKISENTFEKQKAWKVMGDGCKNPRRNGSAFCQDCSDNYKKQNEN